MKKALGYKGRSVWKGYAFHSNLNLYKLNRAYCLRRNDIGKEVYIHNGKDLKNFIISKILVGFKLGQLCVTKKLTRNIHLKKLIKAKSKNKKKGAKNVKKAANSTKKKQEKKK